MQFIKPQYMDCTMNCSSIKLLFFSVSNFVTIDRSIVERLLTGYVTRFRGLFNTAFGLVKELTFSFETLGTLYHAVKNSDSLRIIR